MACGASKGNILERILHDSSAKPENLPLSLLEAITNNFSEDEKIGEGGFAYVYKVWVTLSTVKLIQNSCSC